MTAFDFDLIVAGGGVAGAAAAAAVREFGWKVLVVEPGQRSERRLAGELIHPPGIAALRELGLFCPKAFSAASEISGFVVFPETDDMASSICLPYDALSPFGHTALALDYAVLRENLQTAARAFSHVTFLDMARVVAVSPMREGGCTVSISSKGAEQNVSCRLIVAADGASSPVRAMLGIRHTRRPISTITSYVVDAKYLPAPRFGHIFIGGQSVVLAYAIGRDRARLMFDQPVERNAVPAEVHRESLLHAILPPLRDEVAAAMATQRPLSFLSAEFIVPTTIRGAAVLVGDAGGSCHPLTATGMTIGIRDGLRLRDALRRHDGRIPAALADYDRRRRAVQKSRRFVASAMHDACSRGELEHRLVRAGLLRYWTQDVAGQKSSMAVLAMADDRIVSAFVQFFKVMSHGLTDHWKRKPASTLVQLGWSAKLIAALGALAFRHLAFSMRAR